MSPKPITANTLFYGDNLPILREHVPTESVDLIYLDPPFNSNRSYNVLFKDESGKQSKSQLTAFDDTWHWGEQAEDTYSELVTQAPTDVGKMIAALRGFIGENQMMAYLVMMAARLVELHRVLKPTGSLYLHCDPTASHYLKIVLDTIFGPENYQNEITWKRTSSHSDSKRYPKITDTILFFSKSKDFCWHTLRGDYDESYVKSHYTNFDKAGRQFRYDNLVKPKGSIGYFYTLLGCPPPPNGWRMPETRANQWLAEGRIEIPQKGKVPSYKRYLDEMEGTVISNLWTDIAPVNSQAKDAMGYPTQKPLTLLERIIQASSNPGDVVLDPFCGCGTAIAAAQKLDRRWIGVDVTHLAIALMRYRLDSMFPGIKYEVIGEPQDLGAARQLAQDDRYQFQWWACSLIQAKPLGGQEGSKTGKKGSDKGIDGVITFLDDNTGKPKQIMVQVKSGHVKSGDIRDLIGVLDREKAAIGVFVTLEPPSTDMTTEAIKAGKYHSPGWNQDYRRVQILTIEEMLQGKQVHMPPTAQTFKQAPKAGKGKAGQDDLGL